MLYTGRGERIYSQNTTENYELELITTIIPEKMETVVKRATRTRNCTRTFEHCTDIRHPVQTNQAPNATEIQPKAGVRVYLSVPRIYKRHFDAHIVTTDNG